MKGHHHESCPRRVLQQGELWVDTSRASGQRVRRVVQGLRAVKMGLAPLGLIDPYVTSSNGVATARCFLICCVDMEHINAEEWVRGR